MHQMRRQNQGGANIHRDKQDEAHSRLQAGRVPLSLPDLRNGRCGEIITICSIIFAKTAKYRRLFLIYEKSWVNGGVRGG